MSRVDIKKRIFIFLYGLIISAVPVFSPAILANSTLHIYLILLFVEVMRKVFK